MVPDIRCATPSDIPELRSVATEAWHAAHAPIIGTETVEEFLSEHYDPASFHQWIDREDVILAVATTAPNDIAGYVLALPTDEACSTISIAHLYVRPEQWGNGIGTRLLEHCETAIDARGGERIELIVMADNDRAVGFYEAAGYERTDTFYDDRVGTYSYTYEKAIDRERGQADKRD